MTECILEHDHEEIDDLLRQAFGYLKQRNAAYALQTIDLLWARLAVHIRAEHLHLFPDLQERHRKQSFANVADAVSTQRLDEMIRILRKEHDRLTQQLFEIIKKLRRIASDPISTETNEVFESVCRELEDVEVRLNVHNRREETYPYRWIEQWSTAPDLENLNERMQSEIQRMPPRFDPEM